MSNDKHISSWNCPHGSSCSSLLTMEFHRHITFLFFVISWCVLFHTAHSRKPVDSNKPSRGVLIRSRRTGIGIQPVTTGNVSCDSPVDVGAICTCSNGFTSITCGTMKDPCSIPCVNSNNNAACREEGVVGFNCTCESCETEKNCPIDYFAKPSTFRGCEYCTEYEALTTSNISTTQTGISTTHPEVNTRSDMPGAISTDSRTPVETTNVALESGRMLAEMLLNLSSNPETITPMELETILQELSRLEEAGSTDQNVTTSFISVVNNVMEVSPGTLERVPGVVSVPQLLEDQLSHLHENVENYTQVEENIAVSVLKVNASSFERPVEYNDPLDGENNGTKNNEGTSISLPSSILDIIQRDFPNISSVPLTFIVYRNTGIFLSLDGEEEKVITRAISAKVDIEEVDIENLLNPVVIEFPHQMQKRNSTADNSEEIVCVFWEYSIESMVGEWSTEGCNITLNENKIICHCSHLTSFAVLVRGISDTEVLNTSFAQALSTITTVGCCISIGCLIACLLLMLLVKSVRVKQETRVHINLCISLLGLYLTFVIGIERTMNPVSCKIIAAFIHFFCLASVAWMAVEAFVIYRLIYKYQRSDTKYLIPCSMIFAWGIPLLAAVLVYLFDDDFPLMPDFCFLHKGVGFYFGFLLLAFLLTVYNSVVFTLATYRMNCRSVNAVDKQAKRKEIMQRVYSTILFWVLLGISWLFGFLSAFRNPTSSVFQLLFCVFLTLQGLFLFYFIFAQNPIMRAKVTYILTDQSGSWGIFFRNSRDEIPLATKPTSKNSSNVSKVDSSL